MTSYDYIMIATLGTMVFYALEIVEKGHTWLKKAAGSEDAHWKRVLRQFAVWVGLIALSSCVFTHLVFASIHSAP